MERKMNHLEKLKKQDASIYKAIIGEFKRQNDGIEMVASENYVSEAVLETLGTVFTNKYSEGYPGRRYYAGQEFTDEVENLAIERAKKLFDAEHVNVQPTSGAPANVAAFISVLEPGDKVLGMDLSHGGHLTHGHPMVFASKIFNFIPYKTEENGEIDYDKLEKLAKREKPKMILAGFSAYSRQLDYERIGDIAKKVKAVSMMDMAHIAGLIAGKAIPNPVPYFDIITTTTHKTLRGPRGGMILCKKEFSKQVDKAVFPGLQGGPHMNNIAAKAVAFGEALKPSFKTYAKQVVKNAQTLAKELEKTGFKIIFGKTENHIVLVDVFSSKSVTGKEAETALDKAGITINKNMIPDDPRGAFDPSGVRFGTPAITTRGMKEKEIKMITKWINEAIDNRDNEKTLKSIKKEISVLCEKFPIY